MSDSAFAPLIATCVAVVAELFSLLQLTTAVTWLCCRLDGLAESGLHKLLAGLMFVDPSKDWKTHMQQLLPIENPRGMAGLAGLAKQNFAGSYREWDTDPTDPECPHRQRSTYCHLMHRADDSGLLVPPPSIHQC